MMQMFKQKKGQTGLSAMIGGIGILVVVVLGLLIGFGAVDATGMLAVVLASALVIGSLVIGILNFNLDRAKAMAFVVAGLGLGIGAGVLVSLSATAAIVNVLVVVITPVLTLFSLLVLPAVLVVAIGLAVDVLR